MNNKPYHNQEIYKKAMEFAAKVDYVFDFEDSVDVADENMDRFLNEYKSWLDNLSAEEATFALECLAPYEGFDIQLHCPKSLWEQYRHSLPDSSDNTTI